MPSLLRLLGLGLLLLHAPTVLAEDAPGTVASTGTVEWILREGPERRGVLAPALRKRLARLTADDAAGRHREMAKDPLRFFRATAHVYHQDLASNDWLRRSEFFGDDLFTWVQGDARSDNVGIFADGAGEVIFDLDDFGDAWIASYLVDLWRFGVSIHLVCREAGFDAQTADAAVLAFADAYLEHLARLRDGVGGANAPISSETTQDPLAKFIGQIATKRTRERLLDKWTQLGETGRRFGDDKRLAPVDNLTRRRFGAAFDAYRRHLPTASTLGRSHFRVLDLVRRLGAGLSSAEALRFYVLIEGPTERPEDDRILDIVARVRPSTAEVAEDPPGPAKLGHLADAGCRAALAERALLTRPDPHLGCLVMKGEAFSVRELSPAKAQFPAVGLRDYEALWVLVDAWGRVLASAHARADQDFDPELVPHPFEEVLLERVGDRGKAFGHELRRFARSYARQVETDHAIFL
ncbi:MAG: DUF2252 family protein, partial [Acidobacteriota bacterium]